MIYTRNIWSIGSIKKYCQKNIAISYLEISQKFMNFQGTSLSIKIFIFIL